MFSLARFTAIALKEFIQMKRDRPTLAMMVGIPVLQLVLFGYAINMDPKWMPTLVVSVDQSSIVRSIIAGLEASNYFSVIGEAASEKESKIALDRGDVQFIMHFPPDFTKKLLRGDRPRILLESDATDPVASMNAQGAVVEVVNRALRRELTGVDSDLLPGPLPVDVVIHRKFNPEGITSQNIVPGLRGVVLTMTMVMITALAITRERERGTMENLLSTPARPLEVMLGKIIPYILVGYIQVGLILLTSKWLFDVPVEGSVLLLLVTTLVFIVGNLAVGITFSTVGKNQLQAVQMAFFFFLPSLLLSGFMFPFRGMPGWAQAIGSALPLTHFLRIVRGILLKGNDIWIVFDHLWPILIFTVLAVLIGLFRYRQTLD